MGAQREFEVGVADKPSPDMITVVPSNTVDLPFMTRRLYITTGGAPAPSAPAPVPSAPAAAPSGVPVPPQPQTTLTPAYPAGNGTTPGGAIGTVTLKTSSSVAAGTGSIPAPTATGSAS